MQELYYFSVFSDISSLKIIIAYSLMEGLVNPVSACLMAVLLEGLFPKLPLFNTSLQYNYYNMKRNEVSLQSSVLSMCSKDVFAYLS